MDIMDILKEAEALQDEIAANRRVIHGYAELGFALPKTRTLVWNRLLEYGCSPCAVGKAGVCCDFGKQGPMVLLRADMDALPMKEQSGLPFAATNGNAHACGHDIHTAMLLAAAKLLKNHEDELQGRVRLMFQPAEEILGGAKDMIDHGVLDDVEAAFGLHVAVGAPLSRSGTISVPNGPGSNSADCYTVKVWGKSAHGSRPQEGVDAILIAVRIIEAFQMLLTTEVGMDEHCVLLVGTIKGGTSPNSIPGDAELGVTLRTMMKQYAPKCSAVLERWQKVSLSPFMGEQRSSTRWGRPEYGMTRR